MSIKTGQFSPRAVRLWVVFPVLLLLLYLAYISFRWALADILSVQIRHQLGKAQLVGYSLDGEQWLMTRDWLNQVLLLHPDHSSHLEMAALFYQVAGEELSPLLTERGLRDSREKALAYSRRAALARPTWPYFWNELIWNKLAMKQFDGELTGAMERAVTLGPWEEPVQYDVAYSGLEHWDRLQPEAHPWVMLALDKILLFQKNPSPLLNELKAHPNIGKVCRGLTLSLISRHKIQGRYCGESSPTR